MIRGLENLIRACWLWWHPVLVHSSQFIVQWCQAFGIVSFISSYPFTRDVKENTALFNFFNLTVLGVMQGVEYSAPFSSKKAWSAWIIYFLVFYRTTVARALAKKVGVYCCSLVIFFFGHSTFILKTIIHINGGCSWVLLNSCQWIS